VNDVGGEFDREKPSQEDNSRRLSCWEMWRGYADKRGEAGVDAIGDESGPEKLFNEDSSRRSSYWELCRSNTPLKTCSWCEWCWWWLWTRRNV